jgi:hypothetical protein
VIIFKESRLVVIKADLSIHINSNTKNIRNYIRFLNCKKCRLGIYFVFVLRFRNRSAFFGTEKFV